MCQHWKIYPVNWYFPNDQCMRLQKHARVEDPFKVQTRPMDLKGTRYNESINMVSDSTL